MIAMRAWRFFLLRVFGLMWGRSDERLASGSCANRKWTRYMFGPIEVTITYRDTRWPDGHSREELCEMLRTVRKHEQMGWKCPEDT